MLACLFKSVKENPEFFAILAGLQVLGISLKC